MTGRRRSPISRHSPGRGPASQGRGPTADAYDALDLDNPLPIPTGCEKPDEHADNWTLVDDESRCSECEAVIA